MIMSAVIPPSGGGPTAGPSATHPFLLVIASNWYAPFWPLPGARGAAAHAGTRPHPCLTIRSVPPQRTVTYSKER